MGNGINNFSAGLRFITFLFHGRQIFETAVGVGERLARTRGVVSPAAVSLKVKE